MSEKPISSHMIRTMFGCRSWAESGHAMTVKPDAASRSQWAVVCFFITSYVFFITPTPGPGNTVLTSIKPEIQTTSLGRRDKSTKNRSIRHVAAPEILPRAYGFLPGLRFVLLLFPISALEISVAATENPVTATGFIVKASVRRPVAGVPRNFSIFVLSSHYRTPITAT